MIDLKNLSIKKTVSMIHNGDVSAREILVAYQENIKKKNGEVRAYLETFDEDAFARAEEIDKQVLAGDEPKALSGVPVAIKDNILIKGKICSAGSRILENYTAVYDASVIEKLRSAGAIFIGRTNMDEFAMGSSTETSAFGPTKNPLDLERVPGGSSGGSAAAVAMDGALVGIGSDTGGSVRQPASFCGVVGLKPTYGSVSRYGLIAMASSLDQIGPLTRTVEDAEIVFDVIRGRDEKDSTSVEIPARAAKDDPEKPLKIGVLKYDDSGIDETVAGTMKEAIVKMKKLGHEIEEVELPLLQYSLPCYYIIMPAEVSANLARFDGVRYGFLKQGKNLLEDYMETRAAGFGREARRRVMLGAYVLSAGYYDAYYGKAGKVRAMIKGQFQKLFKDVDAMILPTAPTVAFKFGEKTDNPVQMYLSDVFTVSANLAGIPAISVPGKTNGGLAAGVQFMAPWFREDILFKLGKQYESHE